jgi:hypothetical protein
MRTESSGLWYNRGMETSEKHEPVSARQAPEPEQGAETPESTHSSPEDERDLRDALRASDEAKRKGVYPWEWLKQEIKG